MVYKLAFVSISIQIRNKATHCTLSMVMIRDSCTNAFTFALAGYAKVNVAETPEKEEMEPMRGFESPK